MDTHSRYYTLYTYLKSNNATRRVLDCIACTFCPFIDAIQLLLFWLQLTTNWVARQTEPHSWLVSLPESARPQRQLFRYRPQIALCLSFLP